MPLTRHEVEILGLPAENKTRLRFEDGIDWDLWRYSPDFGFTDGHDYGAYGGSIPDEGWELTVTEVTIPVERLVALTRGLQALQQDASKVPEYSKKADRQAAAYDLRQKLGTLLADLFLRASR